MWWHLYLQERLDKEGEAEAHNVEMTLRRWGLHDTINARDLMLI